MKLAKIYLQFHPIAVHFTNALFPVSLFFLCLYLIFRVESFRYTYFISWPWRPSRAPLPISQGSLTGNSDTRGQRRAPLSRRSAPG